MTRLTVVISVLCALYSPALAEEPAEQLKTAMVRVMDDGERAAVRTKLVSKDRVVPITYRFIGRESMWRVYDIAIDGVSVLSSSQSQIDRLIQHFGYGGMMKLLKLKQSQLVMEQSLQSTKIGRVDPSPASP